VSFKPYPKYKESGVEWLGKVPEHWEVRRLRQIGPLLKGSGGTKEDIVESGVPCVRYGDLYTTHSYFIRQARTFVTAERAADYFPIRRGDVLFAASGEDLAEIGRSAVNLIEAEAVCGGDTVVLRPNGRTVPAFLGYACDCWVAKAQKAAMGRGTTVKHIYPDELKRLVIFVPSLDEQAFVASFLDHETAKIDALIAEQQRLIELLQEKRQAVISHAVTKGLNPNAPMKDSGIEWLGEVPEHWDASKPKHLTTKIVDGVHFKPEYVSEGVPFVTVQNLTAGDGISFDNLNYITPQAHEEYFRRANPEKGDVLLTKDGTLGVARVVDTDRVFSIFVSVALLKPIRDRLDPWFLRHAMESSVVFQQFKSGEQGSALKHIHLVDLRNVTLLLPPLEEQRSIVMALDVELDRLGALIEESRGAIALLQERRSALISAAVTGQIDVRGFTAGGSEDA
jgi:type I restriction enzyme S subunit